MDLKTLVLAFLEAKPLYGYELVQRARRRGQLRWEEGTIYPLLHKMENEGLLHSEWRKAPSGKRRKYYSVTREGSRLLGQARSEWKDQVRVISRILWGGDHA